MSYEPGEMRYYATWKGQGGAVCTTEIDDPRESARQRAQEIRDLKGQVYALTSERDALREALEKIDKGLREWDDGGSDLTVVEFADIARAALARGGGV